MNEELTFISSHGTLVVDCNGTINNELSDLSDWLNDIGKVDVEELDNYCCLSSVYPIDGGDVLDFGYWDKQGAYIEPNREWRERCFHNIVFTEKKNNELIEEAYNWIKQNRGIKK
jgi:hypothetical protein